MIDLKRFQRVPDITGGDHRDTELLKGMAREARDYITSFRWCPQIEAMYLAHGVGGIIALFLAQFSQNIAGTDERLWIVVGDLPSAYMVVEPDDSPPDALERYCGLMEDWIAAVRDKRDLGGVYPVAAKPTAENADLLESRLGFLLAEIIPRATQLGRQ